MGRAVRAGAGRHRTFIAVPLAREIRDAAAGMRGRLGDHADRFRWVSASHLHLTLQFLGNLTDAEVDAAIKAASASARPTRTFAITFAGLGGFPSLAAPRVLWAGVSEGVDGLTALAESLARRLRDGGLPVDPRPFAPHLTLARARGSGRPPDLRAEAEALRGVVFGGQAVREIIVVKSVLGSGEPVHTVVAQASLDTGTPGVESPAREGL